jgi:phage gp29-like protein
MAQNNTANKANVPTIVNKANVPTIVNKVKAPTFASKVTRQAVSQSRKDIREWKWAVQFATAIEPKQFLLQDIYNDIANDALLSSQLNNRREQTISANFELVSGDKADESATEALRAIPAMQDIFSAILDSEWYGNSLIELSNDGGMCAATLINRRNVVASMGRFYPDTSLNGFIEYREVAEFGKWLLEFNAGHLGHLNKAVPHLLFKKFAQSCWSELCEIFGIPPRYLKTNTQDPAMLDRAEKMMNEMGAAAWLVIDSSEEFQFAASANTNGDVYSNLIRLCNNETSMLVSGAVIGQDTENGNESKEKISIEILNRLVDSDKRMVEMYMNAIVLPAFYKIGWMGSASLRFKFSEVEDTDKLWLIVKDILPHKNVDNEFILEKFGIKVTDKVFGDVSQSLNLSHPDIDFFR